MINKLPVWIYYLAHRLFYWNVPVLPKILIWVNRLTFGCYLPPEAKLGRRCRLSYGGAGVVVHRRALIGNDVVISQGVTIGGHSGHYEVPVIEDNVYIGAGAKVLGPIRVGANAIIGANAVVLQDVPPRCRAVGIPARILPPKEE